MIALPEDFWEIIKGKAEEEDWGFVDTHPGLTEGQGLIFLQ